MNPSELPTVVTLKAITLSDTAHLLYNLRYIVRSAGFVNFFNLLCHHDVSWRRMDPCRDWEQGRAAAGRLPHHPDTRRHGLPQAGCYSGAATTNKRAAELTPGYRLGTFCCEPFALSVKRP